MTPTPWSRLASTSIVAINAAGRRIAAATRRPIRALSSLKAYLIGVPLMIAIPVAGIVGGLRLAHSSRFAGANNALINPIVAAGFFLLTTFFSAVRRLGLLAALGITTVVLLAIFFLCAWVIGSLVVAVVRRDRVDERDDDLTPGPHVYTLPSKGKSDDESEGADGELEAFLRS
ncbi:MAG: hypothetical protein ACYDA0_05345 [Candidatus Dormibacteraceae bacterium]